MNSKPLPSQIDSYHGKNDKLHIEKLPEGVYFATSDSVQGLIAQGHTIAETIKIAHDVAKKLIEAMGIEGMREWVNG